MEREASTELASDAAVKIAGMFDGLLAWSRRPASILSAMALAAAGLLVAPPPPDPAASGSPPAAEAPTFLDELDCSIPGDLFGLLPQSHAAPTRSPAPGDAVA